MNRSSQMVAIDESKVCLSQELQAISKLWKKYTTKGPAR